MSTDLAYLAGIVDADGYVTATRSVRKGRVYYGAQVGITGSRRQPHDLAASLFGGNVTSHQPGTGRAHHRRQYHWQRGGTGALPVIEALLPYLRVKVDRARLVIDLQRDLDQRRYLTAVGDDPYPWAVADYDDTAALDLAVREIREAS